MNNSKFARSILKLLGDIVLEHREYHDGLTMLVKDVNAEIDGRDLMEYIEEELEAEGFKDISFSIGDGHWMTIHKESHQVRN
ncbi:hypothetical protein [Robertmurraya massiliosenegalensis]|uniref:hypothetical protein n=1 Tax=Robertmurraya massiliosenegalensis TaxID=1287657 RepID=UPI0002DC1752|nr:hypothetical protein [Robertmurraya massiliosenegalensis]